MLNSKNDSHRAWYRFKAWSPHPLPALPLPAFYSEGLSFWQCSRDMNVRSREYVYLSLVREPLSTNVSTNIHDWSNLHHHPRVLPPNSIHVNLETRFPAHENIGNIFNPQPIHLLGQSLTSLFCAFNYSINYRTGEFLCYSPLHHLHLAKLSMEDSQYTVTERS
jgi:hypothetical protein